MTANSAEHQGLKSKAEEAQKVQAEAKAKLQELTKEKGQIQAELKTKTTEMQAQAGV